MKPLMARDIPSFYSDGSTCSFACGAGYRADIRCEHDTNSGAPWKDCDGHGVVSEWVTRDKAPGEWVLASDRQAKRFYDFAASIKLAKRDGWDAQPYGTGTKGEQAVRAVKFDFEYLRGWCNDEWHYCGVIITLYRNGDKCAEDSCWSIETYKDYHEQHALETLNGMIESDIKYRRQAAARKAKETRERKYWAARGVVTK